MAKEKITGAEAMMRSLEYQGVKTLFGYPGGSIMPTFDALYHHKDTLNHILVRHEQGAAHAAQGFARVSGEVGVCLVTSGPGATNTITGIADAMIDSTPIVVIAGTNCVNEFTMAIMGLPIISFFMPLATHKALAPAIRRPCVLNELRN
jgi:acetolactate synthase I/II/III large subunit